MNQAIVQRHSIEKWLERGAGGTPGLHHIHVTKPITVCERQRTNVHPRLHAGVVHHQQCGGRARRQLGEIRGDALLHGALQAGIHGGDDARTEWRGLMQALGQQSGVHGLAKAPGYHGFNAGILHLRLCPHPLLGHARKQFVASSLGRLGMPVWSQAAG